MRLNFHDLLTWPVLMSPTITANKINKFSCLHSAWRQVSRAHFYVNVGQQSVNMVIQAVVHLIDPVMNGT